jgi:type I restriction enzyme R subunit
MKTDTSEKGLEALIVAGMTGHTSEPTASGFSEEPEPFVGLHDWLLGNPKATIAPGWSIW